MKNWFEKNGPFVVIAIVVLCFMVAIVIPLFVGIAKEGWEWALS